MIYRLDADTLIFMMIRGLKSSNRHQASRERAQKLGIVQTWVAMDVSGKALGGC